MLTSFYGNMLLAIQQRITEMVPEIRYIEQDLGQLEFYQDRPAVSFPCLLVDFDGTKYEQLSLLVEIGDTAIKFRLGHAPYSSSNSLAPTEVREKALEYYELENKVYRALKGWSAVVTVDNVDYELCQPLNRISDGSEQRDDKLRVRAMVFATSFEDESAMVPLQTVPFTPDISFE